MRLTARGQLRCRRGGLGLRVISARTSGKAVAQSSGGKVRRPGGGAADQAQGAGETDPVGIEVGGLGGAGDEHGQGVVHGQPGPDLLVGQVRQPRAQDPPGSAQVGLELIVRACEITRSGNLCDR